MEKTLPTGASKADALALEASIRRQQVDQAIGRPQQYTIAEAMDRWEQDARLLKSWQKDLRFRSAIVRQIAGQMRLSDLPTLAEEIRRRGTAGKSSAANTNRHLAIVRRVGNLAERWGWVSDPVARRIVMVPGERSRDVRLTDEQVTKVMSHSDRELRGFLEFLALTGLRRSEALRLTQQDVKNGVIVVDSRSKSGKPRLVPLAPRARQIALKSIPFELTVSQVVRLWIEARQAAKMPWVRLTDLRHYFGSKLVEIGTDLATVRDLMGHSSLAVTNTYVQSLPQSAYNAVKKLKIK